MTYLCHDTETTGMPGFGRDNPADDASQPRIIQIAATLLDMQFQPLMAMSYLIKPEPDCPPMEPGAFEAHGITLERAMDEGIPISAAIEAYEALFSRCRTVWGYHNRFDMKMIRGARRRLGLNDQYGQRRELDVCQMARKPCALPKSKVPKLEEACEKLLERKLEGAHDAANDVQATIDIALHLHRKHDMDVRGKYPANFEWLERQEEPWL